METQSENGYESFIIIAEAEDVDRSHIEGFENVKFEDIAQARETIKTPIDLYTLSDFTEACNSQILDVLTGSWISYVKIRLA